nr:hypothetical protein [Tanacetum cinerariifolium]
GSYALSWKPCQGDSLNLPDHRLSLNKGIGSLLLNMGILHLCVWKLLCLGRVIPFHMPWRHFDSCITGKVMVREEPHGLDTSILGRVADRTTLPALAGTAIPLASPEEVFVTRPDRKVMTKADHTTKLKASTRSEISTNAARKTRSSKKGFGTEFAMEGIENLNDVSQGFEVGVDTAYSKVLDTAYWGFLEHVYTASSLMDMTYWLSEQ